MEGKIKGKGKLIETKDYEIRQIKALIKDRRLI